MLCSAPLACSGVISGLVSDGWGPLPLPVQQVCVPMVGYNQEELVGAAAATSDGYLVSMPLVPLFVALFTSLFFIPSGVFQCCLVPLAHTSLIFNCYFKINPSLVGSFNTD